MTLFEGFPPQLFDLFEGLERDNSKAYWQAHQTVWREQVRTPMLAILDELAPEFGRLRMFRPQRDVRFSADKSPYKLWAGATSESRAVGGIGYYLQVSAAGMVVGYGAMALDREQLQRFRAAVDDDTSGPALEAVLDALDRSSLPVTSGAEAPLKRGPRGYPATHPRADLLRWKGAAVVQEHARADWMHTPVALDRVGKVWRQAQPLKDWLDHHVAVA